MLLLTVPFVWDEHEQPYDYARYSTFGLKSLLERNGFNVLTQKKLLADSSILFQLINRSEEHTSELQSLMRLSSAVICLKQNNQSHTNTTQRNIMQKTQNTL